MGNDLGRYLLLWAYGMNTSPKTNSSFHPLRDLVFLLTALILTSYFSIGFNVVDRNFKTLDSLLQLI